METDFGFDEYIMPTTYADMPKLESYDAQLYPSDGMGYVCDPNVMTNTTVPLAIPHHHHHHHQPVLTLDHQQQPLLPSSPENESVHSSRQLSPPATTPPLLSCSPTSTSGTLMSQASPITMATAAMPTTTTTAHHVISEKIAQVNKLPESFLPEFHQYSKETYENGASNNKKRRRLHKEEGDAQDINNNNNNNNNNTGSSSSDQEDDIDSVSAAELRRQIHIQSEQKRRAQIKDGFDELRQHLPGCVNKKMSKAALLHRTTQHLQHLKSTQGALLAELERLVNENEQLRKFQESVLHKQALDRMYQMAPM
ncbi:hypothetical protein BDA99DRAFT_494246 [Phascolomyces articulosus]|uniref:BHLH domain-containing protein n=1 Tax=Phascolomyces articulosus TaxID=60185 RepID=A0AAD5KP55_9FUNG|nr:hypothetical protein BDA99DRAFT_494246 [Phascolomyces articulosus]